MLTVACASASFWPPAAAHGAFGFDGLDVTFTDRDGRSAMQAGSHPFAWTTRIVMNSTVDPDAGELPDGSIKDLRIALPPGLIGTPAAVPKCTQADFVLEDCDDDAAVGVAALRIRLEGELGILELPLYNLVLSRGAAGEFGFTALGLQALIRLRIQEAPPYGVTASLVNVTQAVSLVDSTFTVWGEPADPAHNAMRGRCLVAGGICPATDGSSGAFLTLPRSCLGPQMTVFEADSWQNPGAWVSESVETHALLPSGPAGFDGCSHLRFQPKVEIQPSALGPHQPTGLDLDVEMSKNDGLVSPGGLAPSDLREISVALPRGMTVNPGVADGLDGCSPAELADETLNAQPGEGCPNASKIGTAIVETPMLEKPVQGAVFVAQPYANPLDSLFAFYVVLRDQKLGILVKQTAGVEIDPETGQITAAVPELPQLPFSHLHLRFRGGARSPFVSPTRCGAYASRYELTAWSGALPAGGKTTMSVDQDCPGDAFKPLLDAGTMNPVAGTSSDFRLDLTRVDDGEQNVSTLSLGLPSGLAADLGEVPACSDALATAGACPEASRVGSVRIAAGYGAQPLVVPRPGGPASAVYFAGPYKGAPFSFALVVPVQAGPFDLGTVLTRVPIYINPKSAEATIRLDPLPQILRGIPIAYRAVRLVIDRPGFIRNPTSCEEMPLKGVVTSSEGSTANTSGRFQVGDCSSIGFKPRLGLRVGGATGRNGYPRVTAVFRPRGGEANLRAATIVLPRGEYLDQSHIRGVCTRASFAARSCPADSIYGVVRAWSPLLDRPLEGSLYLRESAGRLPDLAVDLDGQIDLDLVGHLDTPHVRVRASFDRLPDVPLSRLELVLRGGKHGLIVNSESLCAKRMHATAGFVGHNGKSHRIRSRIRSDCGKKDS